MTSDIAEAKRKLQLPALMHQIGLGQYAKRSARCPFHDDKSNSFSIFRTNGNGSWRWKCFACNEDGDEIDFLAKLENLSKGDAIRRYCELAGVNGSKLPVGSAFQKAKAVMQREPVPTKQEAFNWQFCVDALSPEDLERLSKRRGLSPEFCAWLGEEKLIGLHDGLFAFPVRDAQNNVVGAHVRADGDANRWFYHPKGTGTTPLVIGKLIPGEPVHVFESTWDGLAFLDVSGERSGVVIARGSSNAKQIAPLISQCSYCIVWTQNDEAGAKFEKDLVAATTCPIKRCKVPAPHKDLNDWTRAAATADDLFDAMLNAETLRELPKPLIEFRSPLQLKNFEPPLGIILAGDCHIVRGSVFVIGGAPSVGKSRAAVALAEAGATRHEWFGLPVHRQFKTMIVQTENGEFRLSREFGELDCEALENFVRICPPPPYGLCFARDGFREQLAAAVAAFAPDVVIYDPWNAAAREQDSREYLDTFDALKSVLPLGDDAPALGIVAHTRKPRADERASGRALLNLLAGSYVLGSVPRTVFVMQPASDDTTDNRIVWTCCKNNDGELGACSAWERSNGLFAPVIDFDWQTFDAPNSDRRQTITETDVAEVFADGPLSKTEAAKRLQESTGASKATAYRALDLNGRFRKHLRLENGLWMWK
jgi:CHC2 zinc finger/AAA domain/Toprim-like